MKPGWSRLRYAAPNVVTCLSMAIGMVAIFAAITGQLEHSAWLLLLCVLLDKLDGTVARLLKATSEIGVQMDSLCDLVTFGVLPGVLIHQALAPQVMHDAVMLWMVRATSIAYVIAAALRLARFNVTTAACGDEYFQGLPSTFAGALVGTTFLLFCKYTLLTPLIQFYPLFLVILAFAMLGNFRFPKVKRRKHRTLDLLQTINIIAVYCFVIARILPEYLVFAAFVYIVLAAIHVCLKRKSSASFSQSAAR